jgi:cation:H+ antiporter
MMSVLCILLLIAFAMAITTGDMLLIGVGVWGLGLGVLSIAAFWLAAGYGARSRWGITEETVRAEPEEGERRPKPPLQHLVWRAAAAGAAIFLAGYALSQTGDALAEQTGLGTGMVGFALIGLATSLPELSTVVAAIRLRQYEMAFGQVLGTNFINLSLIVLADAVFAGGPVIGELGRFEIISALLGASLIGVFLVGLLERRDATIIHMGYDSAIVIVLFFGGLWVLAAIR